MLQTEQIEVGQIFTDKHSLFLNDHVRIKRITKYNMRGIMRAIIDGYVIFQRHLTGEIGLYMTKLKEVNNYQKNKPSDLANICNYNSDLLQCVMLYKSR